MSEYKPVDLGLSEDTEKDLANNTSLVQDASQIEETHSMWESLPSGVFTKIVKLLKESEVFSVESIRLVCLTWKQMMDEDYGLTVKIDEASLSFVKSVNVKEARIVKLTEPIPEDLFLSSQTVKRIFFAGYVPLSWIKLKIPLLENLNKLVFRGGFLKSQVFQENVDYSVPVSLSLLELPSLQSLEIIANEYTFPYMSVRTRLNEADRGAQFDNQVNEIVRSIAANICFLLCTIRCRSLRLFQIYSYEKDTTVVPPSSNWRFHPLENFLDFHKDTLEELYLPGFKGKHLMLNEVRQYPRNLKKLLLSIDCVMVDRDHDREQDSTYLKTIISNQTAITSILMSINDFNQRWLEDILTSLCRNSNETLKFVELTIFVEDNFELSCGTFQSCSKLEVLKINCAEEEAFIRDLALLPASLKQLNLMSCFISLPEPAEMKKYNNLVMLELSLLLIDGGTHTQLHGVLKEIMQNRNLNYMGINFSESVANNPELRVILEEFTAFYSPRMQFTGMKINHNYEMMVGWSDEVFEPSNTDREYIHHQEPENMANWGTSPSISSDPEIIIFDTIPLIIGHLGINAANNGDDDDDDQGEDFSDDLDEIEIEPLLMDDDDDDNDTDVEDNLDDEL